MNRDDIIRWAKEAGWKRVGRNPDTGPEFPVLIGNLERFAVLVAAHEREACALMAESYEPTCDTCPSGVANAIRARKS